MLKVAPLFVIEVTAGYATMISFNASNNGRGVVVVVKKRIWVISIILIFFVMGIAIYFTQSPKINGNPVSFVDIFDPQGKPLYHWTAKENKKEINTLSKALSNQQTLAPINQAPADYWIHIGMAASSEPNVLVWLPSNQSASFVYAFKESGGSIGIGGTQKSYPISDENRDKLLQLLKKQ
jgi:hypothetical protein